MDVDTELLLGLKKMVTIKEVPVNVNEIRPSVYNIDLIPKTLYLILKLRIKLCLKDDK